MPLAASLLLFESSELSQERNSKVCPLSPILERQQIPCLAVKDHCLSWGHRREDQPCGGARSSRQQRISTEASCNRTRGPSPGRGIEGAHPPPQSSTETSEPTDWLSARRGSQPCRGITSQLGWP